MTNGSRDGQMPPLSGVLGSALDQFLTAQMALLERLKAARGLDLTALRFPSPLARYIRMNLLEFFSVGNSHSRRHLWQAKNVRRDLENADAVCESPQ